MGQIYALVDVSMQPLHADDIAEALKCSRPSVTMGLKEQQARRLLKLKHLPCDRREYFEAAGDAWETLRTLAEERCRREIGPTLSMLRNALLAPPSTDEDRIAQARMRGMHDLIELMTRGFDDVQRMDSQTLAQLTKMAPRFRNCSESLAVSSRWQVAKKRRSKP